MSIASLLKKELVQELIIKHLEPSNLEYEILSKEAYDEMIVKYLDGAIEFFLGQEDEST